MYFSGKLKFTQNLKIELDKKRKKQHKSIEDITDKVNFVMDTTKAIIVDRVVITDAEEKIVQQTSPPFKNDKDEDFEDTWEFDVTTKSEAMQSNTTTSEHRLGAELAPHITVKGIGGSLGKLNYGYAKVLQAVDSTTEGGATTTHVKIRVLIPPKSTVIFELVIVRKVFKCAVKGIEVSYTPQEVIHCTVQKFDKRKNKSIQKPKQYPARDIINVDDTHKERILLKSGSAIKADDPILKGSNKIHLCGICAEYEWIEDTTTVCYKD